MKAYGVWATWHANAGPVLAAQEGAILDEAGVPIARINEQDMTCEWSPNATVALSALGARILDFPPPPDGWISCASLSKARLQRVEIEPKTDMARQGCWWRDPAGAMIATLEIREVEWPIGALGYVDDNGPPVQLTERLARIADSIRAKEPDLADDEVMRRAHEQQAAARAVAAER